MIDLDELRKKAEAATPGDWIFSSEEERFRQRSYCLKVGKYVVDDEPYENSAPRIKDAEFIAAANPAVLLELIAEIEKLKYDALTLRCLALTYLCRLGEDDPDEALENDLKAIDIKVTELTG